jgi:hypothetical protein
MLKIRLDKRKKYLLLGGAALLIIGAAYRFFPLLGISDTRAEIAIKERKLAKYQEAVLEKKVLEQKLASRNRTLSRLESGLLSGDTPALAAVDIQNLLKGFAARSGIDIKTTSIIPPSEEDGSGYLIVPVQFELVSNIKQLKEILYRIETSPKHLTIKMIKASVPDIQQPKEIQSILIVGGYMRKPGT